MPTFENILETTPRGLYCSAGGFYIDPIQPVERAVLTHAHSDHARSGSKYYLATTASEYLLRMRLGEGAEFEFLSYGESRSIHGIQVSFHPAGHMLGSAQVRLQYRGRVAVVTGDYKLGGDATCTAWEPVPCHLLVSECTFGLPVYRWQPQDAVFQAINTWWRGCAGQDKCCVLYGYAIGKSQRLLAGLDTSIGPIFTHGAVEKGVEAYRRSGVALPPTQHVGSMPKRHDWRGAMVVAVPSAHGSPWLRRFGRISTAMASGWMAIRGNRRRRSLDRGFVLSDHVDWPSLLRAVEASSPETVWATHGTTAVVARYLGEAGYQAVAIDSPGQSESDVDAATAP